LSVKSSKTGATRCQILRLKYIKFAFSRDAGDGDGRKGKGEERGEQVEGFGPPQNFGVKPPMNYKSAMNWCDKRSFKTNTYTPDHSTVNNRCYKTSVLKLPSRHKHIYI